jgi:hypothetical protein
MAQVQIRMMLIYFAYSAMNQALHAKHANLSKYHVREIDQVDVEVLQIDMQKQSRNAGLDLILQ